MLIIAADKIYQTKILRPNFFKNIKKSQRNAEKMLKIAKRFFKKIIENKIMLYQYKSLKPNYFKEYKINRHGTQKITDNCIKNL